ncbi:hypothetical protein DY000_02004501 [Brassica cretica]|uniref:Uncharacterized protein n=1 Tax=Brassica cretica TaxID=69181 RepID=A0ABQ7BW17_BRACR|nr:hypothetical protein DY000_02004501 [Brassica cretica]
MEEMSFSRRRSRERWRARDRERWKRWVWSSSSCVGEERLREIERERGVRGRERVGFEVETELGSRRSRERELRQWVASAAIRSRYFGS